MQFTNAITFTNCLIFSKSPTSAAEGSSQGNRGLRQISRRFWRVGVYRAAAGDSAMSTNS